MAKGDVFVVAITLHFVNFSNASLASSLPFSAANRHHFTASS